MKKIDLRSLIFMALCCDLGLFAKKLFSEPIPAGYAFAAGLIHRYLQQ